MVDDILRIQRTLRYRLFEGGSAIRWRPARELAAQLLLYLDDPQACWRLTAQWLRDALDADRVDGGYGGYVGAGGCSRSYVVTAEAQRASMGLPTVLGIRFDAGDPAIRAVWDDSAVAAITDVAQESSFSADMRGTLLSLGTSAKLALPLRDGARPVGLICADWHRRAPRWNSEVCNQLAGLAEQVLGPVLAAAEQCEPSPAVARLGDTGPAGLLAGADNAEGSAAPAQDHPADGLAALTPAEWRVARLVAMGLSYKEVARQLDRSLSTVDHRLRSIRDKLGTRSTARLVHLLNENAAKASRA